MRLRGSAHVQLERRHSKEEVGRRHGADERGGVHKRAVKRERERERETTDERDETRARVSAAPRGSENKRK